MTDSDDIEWRADDRLRIGDTEFRVVPAGRSPSTSQQLTLLKNRQMVDAYIELARSLNTRRIVELGIFEGGSTALFELLFKPNRVVAFELADKRVPALDEFIRRRGAEERVRPYFGVDQADAETILPIVHDNFGSSPLDLVVDDASHDLELTRRSFNLLFPLVRPDGMYLIEDWGWGHVPFARQRRGPSLAKLVMNLVLSLPYNRDLIADVTVNRFWTIVRRGCGSIPVPFDISDHVSDRGRQLLSANDEDPRLV